MSLAFLLVGGVIFGIGLAGVLNARSRTLKPKHLRTKTSKYYTLGQLAMVKIKSWWKNYGKEKPEELHFSGAAPNHDNPEKPDKTGDNPLP